ncbi:hypothetical protein [Streptococcus dentiloxodontae]
MVYANDLQGNDVIKNDGDYVQPSSTSETASTELVISETLEESAISSEASTVSMSEQFVASSETSESISGVDTATSEVSTETSEFYALQNDDSAWTSESASTIYASSEKTEELPQSQSEVTTKTFTVSGTVSTSAASSELIENYNNVLSTASTYTDTSQYQSESLTYTSEVRLDDGSSSEITAQPVSSDSYTVVKRYDDRGAKIEDAPVVTGNKDTLYVARGDVFNVHFNVEGQDIVGLNLVLDGNPVYQGYFIEDKVNEVNAGLGDYHLAEQTTGIHSMTFELIDANRNIHYLTQYFSVFNMGETPVKRTNNWSYPPNKGNSAPVIVNVTVNNARTYSYATLADQIQSAAVTDLTHATQAGIQQLTSQLSQVLNSLAATNPAGTGNSAANSNATTRKQSGGFFQSIGESAEQAAETVAKTVSDPSMFGKQVLATATVVFVLLIIYLAVVAFI